MYLLYIIFNAFKRFSYKLNFENFYLHIILHFYGCKKEINIIF